MKTIRFELPAHESSEPDKTIVDIHAIESADEVDRNLAAETLRLLAITYADQFEEPKGSLPKGTFGWHFDPDHEDKINAHAERMRDFISGGSTYWFVPDPENTDSKRALAKASPSRATKWQKWRIEPPNCYLNDLLVAPEWQGQGIGRVLLFYALTSGNFNMGRSLTLDGFAGSDEANQWFMRLGMHAVETEIEPMAIEDSNGLELSRVRYTSAGQAKLEDIAGTLEDSSGIVL